MAAPVMTRPGQRQPAPNGKAPIPARPFRTGVQTVDDQPYDVTVTTTASTQALNPQYEVPSTGFLNDIFLLVEGTVTTNSTNSVSYNEDNPFTVLDTVTFTDTNNQPIIGPVGGWDLYVINKYGGYAFQDDPKSSPIYTAVTGTGGTGGSFSFCLRIPIQLVPREGLGSLPNKSASTPFKVKITVAATASIYNQVPSAAPSVRFRMAPVSYWQPQAADAQGNPLAQNPPGVDTTQYWNKTDYTVTAGAISPQLTSSVGFPVRNLIFVLRATSATGSRATGETDFPDPFKVKLEANIMTDRLKSIWKTMIAQNYGYSGATFDAAGAKDNGLYVLPFCLDFYSKPGWESRRGYLPTTDAMRLQALGTVGGSGTHNLSVYTNYVAPGAGSSLAAITS
jgi:hypothetical protein